MEGTTRALWQTAVDIRWAPVFFSSSSGFNQPGYSCSNGITNFGCGIQTQKSRYLIVMIYHMSYRSTRDPIQNIEILERSSYESFFLRFFTRILQRKLLDFVALVTLFQLQYCFVFTACKSAEIQDANFQMLHICRINRRAALLEFPWSLLAPSNQHESLCYLESRRNPDVIVFSAVGEWSMTKDVRPITVWSMAFAGPSLEITSQTA